MSDDRSFLVDTLLPKALRALGYGDREKQLLQDGILWVVAKVGEIDRRAATNETLTRAIAVKLGIDPNNPNGWA